MGSIDKLIALQEHIRQQLAEIDSEVTAHKNTLPFNKAMELLWALSTFKDRTLESVASAYTLQRHLETNAD